jgi:hypothetical protein
MSFATQLRSTSNRYSYAIIQVVPIVSYGVISIMIEWGPVYGPTLPPEAEHPKVVIRDINAHTHFFVFTPLLPFILLGFVPWEQRSIMRFTYDFCKTKTWWLENLLLSYWYPIGWRTYQANTTWTSHCLDESYLTIGLMWLICAAVSRAPYAGE